MMLVLYLLFLALALFLVLRLACGGCVTGRTKAGSGHLIPLFAAGWALSFFLAITYVVCVAFDALFPGYEMYQSWSRLLPGFVWLTPAGFAIGLVEAFSYGWYVVLVFVPLYNVLVTRVVKT
ncbi:DUF5676 family membrane protein [Kordiimonas sp.]|uniref:DUF5676 family membrane protein n=1 Tax=Kordiimonas sp. TaxID=1970157 RepID=UPI003A95905C